MISGLFSIFLNEKLNENWKIKLLFKSKLFVCVVVVIVVLSWIFVYIQMKPAFLIFDTVKAQATFLLKNDYFQFSPFSF